MPRLLVNIDVSDVEQAVSFYTAGLGLQLGRRFGPGAVELLGADVPIYLLHAAPESPPYSGARAARRYDRHWTPVHLDLVVDDVEAAILRATAAGARVEIPVHQRAFGKLAVLSDPFGHGFCFIEFEGRGYDAVATSPAPGPSPASGS